MSTPDSQTPDYWEDIFPFDPYANQIEGINQSINTLRDGGIHLLEGPCGTGKTLIALTAGLSLVRDRTTKFERVLVITSKKQQLSAFEDDLKEVNSQSEIYFEGLSLVGKSDLCPYVQAGQIDKNDIYHQCISLRDNTRQLMVEAVKQKRTQREANAAFGLKVRAKREPGIEETLSFDDVDAPFQPELPTVGETEYCPFYASHITNSVKEKYPLNLRRVTTAQETLKEGARAGTCPHLEMRRLHDRASVLFGNYKHVFDPTTVGGLTGDIIGDSTLLIADEAHGLVQEVRDQLSYQISYSTLRRGIMDINEVQRWASGKGNPKKCRLAEGILNATDLNIPDLGVAAKFLKKIQEIVANDIVENLKAEYDERWQQAIRDQWKDEISIPLQDPSTQEPDSITVWASQKGYGDIWEKFLKASKVVSVTKNVVARKIEGKSPDGSFPIGNAHELLERWWVGDHTEYYREVTLEPRANTKSDPPQDKPWKAGYRARLKINNCIPQNEIAGTLDVFGGAMLMSATLSPLNIYREVTGISKLDEGTQPTSSLVTMALPEGESDPQENPEEKQPEDELPDLDAIGPADDEPTIPSKERQRDVGESAFELGFPEENRLSLAVDVPRFTWSNRWPPEDNQGLRKMYRSVIATVVKTTPGNVLVTMPSYQEASWASEILANDPEVEKKILTDTSSSDTATEQLKRAFFDGPPKVLTTSLRGTLTEGVDFDGDKLLGAVVCGVPITNTSSNLANAIETAYDYRFNNKGFEYAFSIPAIRKTRQALGRVIRGDGDVGVRVLVDERYVRSNRGGVKQYFPDYEAGEFVSIGPDELPYELESFWQNQDV
jgi:DNA excision repair protein ERCC-2